MTFGSLAETSMSSSRPPILAGPIERNLKLERSGLEETLKLVSRSRAPRPCAASGTATSDTATSGRRRRKPLLMVSVLKNGGERSAWRKYERAHGRRRATTRSEEH